MPRHERAQAIAEAKVAEAIATQAKELSLAGLRIETLPPNFKDLAGQLEALDLGRCGFLRGLSALKEFHALRSLSLADCRRLSEISSLSALSGLQALDLSGCSQLADLSCLASHRSLRTLNLSWCEQLTDLSTLAALSGLHTLDLSRCGQLADLSALTVFSGLQMLDLSGCEQLTDLSALAALSGLQILALSGCEQLTDLSALAKLSGLQTLDLSGCERLTDLSALAKLSGLQTLDLSGCERLTDLSALAKLSGLQTLDLSGCGQMIDLSALAALSGLQTLDLNGCERLTDMSALAAHSGLHTLNLRGCEQLTDLSPLAKHSGLNTLDLRGCVQLTNLSALATHRGLDTLALSRCELLTDLSALAALSGLRMLDLSECERLTDLSALAALSGLHTLNLNMCRQLTDLSALATHRGLDTLVLSRCERLADLSALAALSGLRMLDLSECGRLADLSALATLSGLHTLNLSMCRQLTDLSALAALSGLHTLNLSMCRQLTDLSALAALGGLHTLYLSMCRQLTDLSALAALDGLHTLNLPWCSQLTNLSALAMLSGLRSLDVSECEQLTDLSALAALNGLQALDLSGCRQLTDLSALAELDDLEDINLMDVPIAHPPNAKHLWSWWPRLFALAADDLPEAPRELLGIYCLDGVSNWLDDIEVHGSAPADEIKLLVLGNGRIGKTQVARRLCGEDFDPTVPSTHGVVVREFALPSSGAQHTPNGPVVRPVRMWDFGGQDLFLGTHSLFLDDRALYLLLWHPELEDEAPVLDGGMYLPSHSLSYWLDYLKATVGPMAQVIVAQARCDEESSVQEPPVPADHGFHWLRRIACSARSEDGLDRLMPELRAGAKLLSERNGEVLIPRNWASLSARLRRLEESKKLLPQEEFQQLCEEHGVRAPQTLLNYLHQSGQVFWRPNVFGGAVILDQAWALEGVYALLHREKVLPTLRRQGGRFTRELLSALMWEGQYDVTEQEHFLSLMKSCRVCFGLSDGQYIAPDCLRERAAMTNEEQAVWRDADPDAVAHLEYPLLHGGLQRMVLCELGELAGVNAVYWRYGLCFYDAKARVALRLNCDAGGDAGRQGRVVIEAAGAKAGSYVAHLIEHLQHKVKLGQSPKVHWMKGEAPSDSRRPPMSTGDEEQNFKDQIVAAPLPAGVEMTKEKPVVYVSYAWGGDSDAVVDGLQQALAPWVDVHRDKSVMRTGDSIREFEAEIGRGSCVLVVLSARYGQSTDCMRELGFVWERAQRNAGEFAERVIPVVLDDARISTPEQRLAHVQHWQAELAKLEQLVQAIGLADCGQSTVRLLQDIRSFKGHLADALDTLADRVMPRGKAMLEKSNYTPVIDLVKRRLNLG